MAVTTALYKYLPHFLILVSNAQRSFLTLFSTIALLYIVEQTISKIQAWLFVVSTLHLSDQGCFPPSVARAPPIAPYTAAPINPGGNLDPYNVYGLTKGTPMSPRETPM